MIKRICVVGAESTGKTTLSIALAKQYQTCFVPEYGRTYTEGRIHTRGHDDWETWEFVHIATMQNACEDALAKVARNVLICDTDAFATGIWHEKYMGGISTEVQECYKNRTYELYILTDPRIPYAKDEIRVGEASRQWMHERFVQELEKDNKRYIIVTGNEKVRMHQSVKEINTLII